MIEFTKRTIKKVVIALLIFMMITNYIMPKFVFADDDESKSGGGVLLKPIFDFIVFLDDAVLSILQNSFIIDEPITIDAEVPGKISWKSVAWVAIGTAVIIGSVMLMPVTGGASSGIAAFVGAHLIPTAIIGGSVAVIVGSYTRIRFYKRRI